LFDMEDVMNIYDIAKEANVSIATVSRVMNNKQNISPKTRKRVEAVLQKYNYTPSSIARGLASSSMRMVGMVMQDIRNTHYTDTAYVIEQELRKKGFCCLFCNTDSPDPTEAFKMLRDFRVDGIMLIGSVFMNQETLNAVDHYHPNTRIVFVNGVLDRENVCSVQCDDRCGIEMTVEHLVERGHRCIVYIDDMETDSVRRKREGYCTVMNRSFPGYAQDHMFRADVLGFEGGYRVMKDLLERGEEITAVVCSEDVVALGAIRALEEKNLRIPEDVAVAGFNNAWVGKLSRHVLTSADTGLSLMGVEATRAFCDRLEGVERPQRITLAPKLFVGTTT